ncbi:hypothetical protein L914_19893, partial [Phytophthora nicotianae]
LSFMMELVTELISGKWSDAPSEAKILYSNTNATSMEIQVTASINTAYVRRSPFDSPKKACTAVESKQFFSDSNR